MPCLAFASGHLATRISGYTIWAAKGYSICVRATAFRKVSMSVILISNTTATGNRDNIGNPANGAHKHLLAFQAWRIRTLLHFPRLSYALQEI